MNFSWNKIKDTPGPDLKYLKTHYHQYESNESPEILDILVVSSKDAANVIPLTSDLDVVLVKQYRFGIEDFTIEIPGGIIEKDESSLVGIKRELSEETGYSSNEWKKLGSMPFNPVYHKNFIHHFIAENVSLTDDIKPDLGEEIEVILWPLAEVLPKVKAGKLPHPHAVSAFMLAYDYLSSLLH